VDESAVSLQFPLRRCWMRRGQQRRLPAAQRPQATLHLFGAYNWRTSAVCLHTAQAKNADRFIDYLEQLLTVEYPSERLVLVLDNAPFHHSKQVQAYLSLFEQRVLVCWLPPYSPDLNLIERFWKHLKDHLLANKLFLSLPALASHLQHFVAAQNQPGHPLRLAFSNDFP
jgi:transposase